MPTPPRAAVPPSESAPLELTSMNLGRLYLPGGGLGYSFLIHGIVLTVVQLLGILSVVDSLTEGFLPGQGAMGSRSDVRMVMYLPSMGGGGQGEGGGSESSANQPTPAPSSGTEGLVFPGPQVIHSDSPLPNNRFQTLLQPELEDLPILEGRLDLPNFLSMPEALYIAKPEQEQPADPSEGVAAEPVQAQLEDLPISKRRLDVDDLFLMPEVPDVETEPVQAQLEDLPISKRHLDLQSPLDAGGRCSSVVGACPAGRRAAGHRQTGGTGACGPVRWRNRTGAGGTGGFAVFETELGRPESRLDGGPPGNRRARGRAACG